MHYTRRILRSFVSVVIRPVLKKILSTFIQFAQKTMCCIKSLQNTEFKQHLFKLAKALIKPLIVLNAKFELYGVVFF